MLTSAMFKGKSAFGLLVLLGLLSFRAAASTPMPLRLDDLDRGRMVPVLVYAPAPQACHTGCPVLLFGTGYRAEPQIYSFLLEAMTHAGFLVVGIQHDLPHDPPMPSTGHVQRDRMPFWERGEANVRFVTRQLQARFPEHNWNNIVLAGHSQGGDIAARMASRPQASVRALVTLDNRRVPLPRLPGLPVLTLRSADQPADPGVLPAPGASDGASICQLHLTETRHDDMNNDASPASQQRMINGVRAFLQGWACPAVSSDRP